jgi:hypothetical protein
MQRQRWGDVYVQLIAISTDSRASSQNKVTATNTTLGTWARRDISPPGAGSIALRYNKILYLRYYQSTIIFLTIGEYKNNQVNLWYLLQHENTSEHHQRRRRISDVWWKRGPLVDVLVLDVVNLVPLNPRRRRTPSVNSCR